MISLFNQYKNGDFKSSDEVRKKARKSTRRTARTITAIALDRTVELSNTLTRLDPKTTNEAERLKLITTLEELVKLIEKKFLY
jgi:hypothetical protein